MPMHDWTRVEAGIYHHFHHEWISAIGRSLNRGLLPEDYVSGSVFVRRYKSNGIVDWTRQFGSSTGGDDAYGGTFRLISKVHTSLKWAAHWATSRMNSPPITRDHAAKMSCVGKAASSS